MPIRTFDFCALQFLNQWLDKEAGYCEKLVSGNKCQSLEALAAAAAHFRIARNLPTEYEQARISLGTSDGDYRAFHHAFSQRYADYKGQIEQACANVVKMASYTVRPEMTPNELESLVSSSWFRERVLDIYLWSQGNA